jgi:large subunit ribosomal protein L25
MSTDFELSAETRTAKGTGASRRLRREGKIPTIIYGGEKDPAMVSLDHDTLWHLLENEAFHTSILKVNHDGATEQAVLRDVHYHPHKPVVMHIDLQRISANEKIHMRVPLHFVGQEVAPGVKIQGGIVTHIITEVDVNCLPSQLPEYIEVDMSGLDLHESVHLSDLKLPEGVELTSLSHGDQPVASISAVKTTVEEEEVAPEEGEAPAEGEAKPEGE